MTSMGRARVLALACFFVVGCVRLVPLTPTSSQLLSQAQQPDVLRAAIVRALGALQYVAESEEPGRVIVRYERRGQILRLQIDYSETQYVITYLDSVGFGQQVNPDGQNVISSHYPRQVRTLTERIEQEIARPAREAAEAAERERQQQLQLAQQETARQQAILDAQQRDRDAQRNAELEAERLRTARAQAEADANRPIIVQAPDQGTAVPNLAFDAHARVRPGYGTLHVRGARFDAQEDGYAGGPIDAASMNFPNYCRGFFSEQPSHVLRVDRARPVRIDVSSQIDTTLAIVTSDGNVWCDDDSAGGLNPRIEGELPAGVYYVWVGAYRANQQAPYRIDLVEYQPQPAVAAAPARPVRSPECTQAMIQRGYGGSDLAYCDNVEPQCAVAMIERGYSGSDVANCVRVEPRCAVAMINRGYSGGDVANCQGVEPQCAEAMIQRGYSGRDVAHCRGVEPSCAVAAIQRGYSGADVANCR